MSSQINFDPSKVSMYLGNTKSLIKENYMAIIIVLLVVVLILLYMLNKSKEKFGSGGATLRLQDNDDSYGIGDRGREMFTCGRKPEQYTNLPPKENMSGKAWDFLLQSKNTPESYQTMPDDILAKSMVGLN